ncbi:hypothetical protein RND81_06G056400 [Saponaria officinalis]|uniref:Uncharacterized protein n=1 Tax=Saponaria officinalis TaxID=3572 RepID=A0AAW1K848_SAPOF
MAEAALLGLATNAAMAMGQLLKARAIDEMKLAWGLKDELEKLQTKFSDLQPFLMDVGSAKHADQRTQVTAWLQKVKDAAYCADDIMDDYAYELLRRELEQNKRFKKKFRDFFSRHNPFIFRVKMSHKVSNALAIFDDLESKAKNIGLKQVDMTRDGIAGTWTDNYDEDDEEKLLEMLCHPSNQERQISTIAIIGIGGLGKTTFARRLHDEKVHDHFEKRLWISVSEPFVIKTILNEMVESVTSKKEVLDNVDTIIKRLQEKLKKKKYLLVLDDVWCTDQELWSSLKNALQRIGGLQGSVILITTRINEVATRSGAVHRHFLKGLSEDESWNLLKQKAFTDGTSPNISILEEVGRRIVNKCEGVPLAIKAIGAILQSKQYPREWEAIENSDVWDLPQSDQNQILPSLRLSFNHLPSPAMKQCFAYCAVFLKNYNLEKDELVDIWLAQGFLHGSEKRNLTMEEVGEEYVKVLHNYSLFQEVVEEDDDDDDDDDTRYKMHDLVHDLAVDVSGKEVLFWKSKDQEIDNCRHLVLTDAAVVEAVSQLPITNTLRKLRTISGGLPPNVLAYAKYLRTLTVDACEIKEVPSSIGLLKHLRFLSLSYNPIETLPDTIGKLYLLQTLRLLGCDSMKVLPTAVYRLVKLIHIPTTTSMHASRGLQQLAELQTLPHLALSSDDDKWSIDELETLNKLRGEIHISGLEHVKTKEKARKADLAGKTNVSKLILVWAKKREELTTGSYDEDVLDGLQPHPNITSLELRNFYGLMFPSWMMRMAVISKDGSSPTPLNNITSLKLRSCRRCQTLPKLGQLPCLKYLTLSKLNIECIENDFYGVPQYQSNSSVKHASFPSLMKLEISKCHSLKTWVPPPSGEATNVFPCLEVLRVTNCPELETMPALDFQSLKKLKLRNVGIQSFSVGSPKVNLMLETLEISLCKKLVSLPSELRSSASLKTMKVTDCPDLTSLPDDLFYGLTSLNDLCISRCEALNNIPTSLEGCTSLTTLRIEDCPSINGPLPDFSKLQNLEELYKNGNPIELMISMMKAVEHLPCLTTLEIGRFKDEEEQEKYFSNVTPIQRNQSITDLYLEGNPNIESLPEQLKLLTGIKVLAIRNFDDLAELHIWVAHLSSLEELWLGRCSNLKHLPSKEVFLQMTRLRELHIWECPILAESCGNVDAPDWSKISHIPFVEMDDVPVQNL